MGGGGVPICLAIIGTTLCTTLLSELVAWHFCYRKKSFQEMVDKVHKKESQVAAEKVKFTSEPPHRRKHSGARLRMFEEQLKAVTQEAAMASMKAQLIPAVCLMVVIPMVMRLFRGTVAATLPFEPIWPFDRIVHQGLTDPNPTDCSATAIYFLTVAVMRAFIRRLIPSPKLPSLWDLTQQQNDLPVADAPAASAVAKSN